MPRCKNGTRRNKKTGKCEKPKRRLRSNTKRTRRCPNGTRRIPPKTGQCVKRSKKVSVTEVTEAKKRKEWDKLVKRALKVEDKMKSGTIHPGTDEYWKNMKEMREISDALDALGYKPKKIPKEITERYKLKKIMKGGMDAVDSISRNSEADRVEAIKAELRGMKVKALKKRAKEVGVEEGKLDDADDADDVKETVIGLILNKMPVPAALVAYNSQYPSAPATSSPSEAALERRREDARMAVFLRNEKAIDQELVRQEAAAGQRAAEGKLKVKPDNRKSADLSRRLEQWLG